MATLTESLYEKLGASEREAQQQTAREKLRDSVVSLREPSRNFSPGVASAANPTFHIGPAPNFPHQSFPSPLSADSGHLSKSSHDDVLKHLQQAAMKPDAASRDAATGRAAGVVANDFQHKVKEQGLVGAIRDEARAQVTFVTRELAKQVGMGPATAAVVGYSFERALEKEGFKVFVNHAVDKSVDLFKATTSSVASHTGMRATLESGLSKSMNWLAAHGVTPDNVKGALTKHAGVITAVTTVVTNPEAMKRAAYIVSQSDDAVGAAKAFVKDEEFRKASGTMLMAGGATVGMANKGLGSALVVAGAIMRGEGAEETGRHVFRAAMSIAGGAMGGLAGAGVLSVGTAAAGAWAGDKIADKVLEIYDRQFNNGKAPDQKLISDAERNQSLQVIKDRVSTKGSEFAAENKTELKGQVKDMAQEREFSMSQKPRAS